MGVVDTVASTHVGPTDHVSGGPVQVHEGAVLEDLVGEINPERKLKQAKAEPDCAVFTTQGLERAHVKDLASFAQLGFLGYRLYVRLAVLQETAEACFTSVL